MSLKKCYHTKIKLICLWKKALKIYQYKCSYLKFWKGENGIQSRKESHNLIISEAEWREMFAFGEFTTIDSTFIKRTIYFIESVFVLQCDVCEWFYVYSGEPVAKRGLAFADHYSTPPVQNSSALDERSQFEVPSMPSNVPQFGYGKSAFRPVGHGVQNRPSELMPKVTPASSPPNISNYHNQENRLQNPSSDFKVGAAFVPETSSVNGMPFPHESTTGNKFLFFSRTPDSNKSGDLNSSNLTGPSPTVFTKQALMVVRDMFAGPLESEVDQTDRDFEAAFSSDHTTRTSFAAELGGLGRYKLSFF